MKITLKCQFKDKIIEVSRGINLVDLATSRVSMAIFKSFWGNMTGEFLVLVRKEIKHRIKYKLK